MSERMQRIADWHGEQAAKAYHENDIPKYLRHVAIADGLWSAAMRQAAKTNA